MAVDSNGKRFWPLFGTVAYCDQVPNLKRFQAIQETQTDILFKAQGDLTAEDFINIEKILNETLGSYYKYRIEQVDSFPAGKHEEFICLI